MVLSSICEKAKPMNMFTHLLVNSNYVAIVKAFTILVLDLLLKSLSALTPNREKKGTEKGIVKCSTTVTKYKDVPLISINGYRLVHMSNSPPNGKTISINYTCDSSFKERNKNSRK